MATDKQQEVVAKKTKSSYDPWLLISYGKQDYSTTIGMAGHMGNGIGNVVDRKRSTCKLGEATPMKNKAGDIAKIKLGKTKGGKAMQTATKAKISSVVIGDGSREFNRVADGLTGLGHSLDLGISFFDALWLETTGLLKDDFEESSIAVCSFGNLIRKIGGKGTVLEAELWGIFDGLRFAWRVGYIRIVVKSDSHDAVVLLHYDIPRNHPLLSIIHACKELIKNDWVYFVKHIFRECNRVADGLPDLGHFLDLGISFFDAPPPEIAGLMKDNFEESSIAGTVFSC
ncbi:hypothetical protein QYF36_004430 [Acer negundo]|nr:hypothetical protein QYF36_004430 [Acer negundo]